MSSLISGLTRIAGLTGESEGQQQQQQQGQPQQQGQQPSQPQQGQQPSQPQTQEPSEYGQSFASRIESMAQMMFGTTLKDEQYPTKKVSIVGTGQVGTAIAYTLMAQDITHEIALYDIDEDRLNGELLDLKQCLPFMCNIKLYGDNDLKVTKNSSVVIITAGERQDPGEDRQALLERNTKVYKDIVPNLVKYSPDAVFLVVTNPPDTLAYYTWKLSGLPEGRVIGHGTNLDSCRFRYFIGEALGISPHSVNAWVVGEHGEKAVPVWSSINVGGANLHCMNPKLGTSEDPGKTGELFQKVLQSADKITGYKGYTNWAAGLSVSKVVRAILKNERSVYALSTSAKNWKQREKCDISEDVFMSLPCVVGQNGVVAILNESFTDDECKKVKECAEKLKNMQEKMKP